MSDRSIGRLLIALLLLLLGRHLLLACSVHPFADDFSYAVAGMRSELLPRLVQEYLSWNGRYFSNILLLRSPLVLGLTTGLIVYRAVAIALILFTVFAAERLLRMAFGEGLSAAVQWVIALLFTLLFLQRMPDANEGFYWFTGAMTYQLPNALSLFLLGNWIAQFQRGRASRPRWFMAQVVLIVVIAGCNEVHMALLVLFHAALLFHRYIQSRKLDGVVGGLLLASVACAVVVAIAPGNATRGALFPHQHEVFLTLGYAAAQTVRFSGTWLFLSPLILLSFALAAFNRSVQPEFWIRALERANKWWTLVLPFLLVFIVMVITYWPTGLLGQYRTVNVAFFYFIPAWCYAVLVWDVQVFKGLGWRLPDLRKRSTQWTFVILCVTCFLLLGRDGRVTDDLLSGRAVRYDFGIRDGYRAIRWAVGTGADQLILAPVEIPTSLHILPLDTSPDHWTNRSLADYFGNAALDLTVAPAPTGSMP